MGRVINAGDTPAKRRHAAMRSCAEVLRLLAQRSAFDTEGRDMAAFLVFNLEDIYTIIDESAHTWDERGYWKKAEGLRERYRWARKAARSLRKTILANQWEDVPPQLIALVPHFNDITVSTITRDADWWAGAYRALERKQAKAG